jgi:hypothetical protein
MHLQQQSSKQCDVLQHAVYASLARALRCLHGEFHEQAGGDVQGPPLPQALTSHSAMSSVEWFSSLVAARRKDLPRTLVSHKVNLHVFFC